MAPVLVGTGIAVGDEAFRPDVLVATLVAAVSLQVAVNFANDLSDAVRGADTAGRIGPIRVVATGLISQRQMRRAIVAVLSVAGVAGAYLTVVAGPIVLAIGVAAVIAALGYTGGPVPYGYRGLGEVFVFVFFGLVATVGTRFVYDGTAAREAWIGGVVMGLLAAAILVANNVRDIETDRAAGKRTLAVVIGRQRSTVLYDLCVFGAFAVIVGGVTFDALPPGALLSLGIVPFALRPARTLAQESDGRALVGVLKTTARLELAVAVVLAGALSV